MAVARASISESLLRMMWNNLYLYAGSFLAHWWPLVSAGSLIGFEEFVQRYWPKFKEKLDKIPDGWRRNGRVTALLVACIYSGYLAWSDEHNALLEAQKQLAQRPEAIVSGSRMVFSRIEPELQPIQMEIEGEKQNLYSFKIWFQNSGPFPAQSVSLKAQPILTDLPLTNEEEEKYWHSTLAQTNVLKTNNDIQPGDRAFYYSPAGYLEKAWNGFLQQKKYLYIFASLTYRDEALTDTNPISTDVCLFYSKNDLNTWKYCSSGHNKITRPH